MQTQQFHFAHEREFRPLGCVQGDECSEQDALSLKQQLDNDKSAKIEVDGEQVIITPNMVEIRQEMKSGG